MIELGYFLYACRCHHLTPLIQERVDMRVEEGAGVPGRSGEKKVAVVVWYRLEEGKMQENFGTETYQKVAKEMMDQWVSYS